MFAPPVAKAQTKATASSTSKLASQRSTLVARPFGGGVVEQALMLQRNIGNQATLRLLSQRARNLTGNEPHRHNEQQADPASLTVRGAAPGVSWDFSKIPIFPTDRESRSQGSSQDPGIIQPKLVVGQANDPLEHEADRIADHVMRMPEPALSVISTTPQLNRKCAACEEEVHPLQTKTARSSEAVAGEAPGIVHEVLRSPGQPLDASTRIFMERRFRHDFTGVRVHDDAVAASSARAVNAHAYTLGNHVVFAEGQYSPDSAEGRHLLAHELAHVIQSGTFPQRPITSEPRGLQLQKPGAFDDNASYRNTDSDPTYTTAVYQTPATQTALLQVNKYSGHSAELIFRSESVHPEEQHCKDLSKDPTASCLGIIECINDLIEELAGRFAQFAGDAGHLKRIEIVQGILKTLMALAALTCKNGEYDKELEEEAQKWVDKRPAQSSTWDTVLKVVIVLGLSIALVSTIIAALADPEPASKLALAGLTFAEISALAVALGFSAPSPPAGA
jgi:hypothetical protein